MGAILFWGTCKGTPLWRTVHKGGGFCNSTPFRVPLMGCFKSSIKGSFSTSVKGSFRVPSRGPFIGRPNL